MKISFFVLICYFALCWKAFGQYEDEPQKVIIFSRIPEGQWDKLSLSNADFSQNPTLPTGIFIGKDISESNLSSTNLQGTGIEQAENLNNVNFDEAQNAPKDLFVEKDIYGTNLNGQDLTHTGADKAINLGKVNFTGAINPPADLLANKDISGAILNGLDLTHSGILKAKGFSWVNFTGAKNPPPNFLANRDISFSTLYGLDVFRAGALQATGLQTADFSGAIFSKDVFSAPEEKIEEIMKNKQTLRPVFFEGKEMSFKEFVSLIKLSKAFAQIEKDSCNSPGAISGPGDVECYLDNAEGGLFIHMDPLQEIVRRLYPAELARLQLTSKAHWNWGKSRGAKRAIWEYYLPIFSLLPRDRWNIDCILAFEKLIKDGNLLKHPFFRP